MIGPEGGFSDKEVQQTEQAGFTAVQLGPRVLRTETAALTAIAALQLQLGDLATANTALANPLTSNSIKE